MKVSIDIVTKLELGIKIFNGKCKCLIIWLQRVYEQSVTVVMIMCRGGMAVRRGGDGFGSCRGQW